MANYYLVKLDEDVIDKHGVNAHLVVAKNTSAAVEICVDNAHRDDIQLWYEADVELIGEAPACIDEKDTNVILTGVANNV